MLLAAANAELTQARISDAESALPTIPWPHPSHHPTQARISDAESAARRDYFRGLTAAAALYAELHAAASGAVAGLKTEDAKLEALYEAATDLAAQVRSPPRSPAPPLPSFSDLL